MRKLLLMAAMIAASLWAHAQYDVHYSQFMHNKLAFNPAFAGNNEVLTFSALYRNQWLGIDGAPTTVNLHAHTPFLANRGGIGLSLISDRIGRVNTSIAGLSYAYRMKLNDESTLNVGLQMKIEHSRIDWTDVNPLDQGDGQVPLFATNKTNPNFGVGIMLSNAKYYVALSAPTLLRSTIYTDDPLSGVSLSDHRSYYLMGGFLARLSRVVKLKPEVLISYNPSAPFELAINGSVIFFDQFWLGAGYRLGDAIDGLVLFQVSNEFRVGFAYDYTLTKLQQFSNGSIELMLDYRFQKKGKRINNIRFF
ncbi:MAG: type IX secretion system membrane protein PorP/SprF [Bacteroidota bacterium]